MAMANSTEFYSDLRGTEQGKKRERDHDAKWKNGPTIKGTHCGQTCLRLGTSTPGGMDMILARNNEAGIKTHWKPHKMEDRRQYRPTVANMYKPRGPSSGMAPTGRIRSFVSVQEELRNDTVASLIDLLPAQRTGHGTVFDGVSNTPVYGDGTSEASAGPPPQPLTLDFFVVESARGTEKLVEKEYEVLDANGEKVRGRKVRQVLRGAKNKGDGKTGNDEVPTVEDDGFELV